jgi:glycosyltransferase involved in cell wall biosynthesis
MRIVLVSPFTPPLKGGLENVCAAHAADLRAAGHDAAIVGQFASGRHDLRRRFLRAERERTYVHDGLPVTIVRPRLPWRLGGLAAYSSLWRSQPRPAAIWFLERWFGRGLRYACAGADIVHYLGTGTETLGFATAAAARAVGAALCVQPAIHAGSWGDRPLDAILYRGADGVLVFSAAEAAIVCGLGASPDRVHRVSPSISWDGPGDAGRFRARHGIRGPIVLFLGRKTADKGVDRLLAAWPAIRRADPTATLVFMGPTTGSVAIPASGGVIDVADADEQEKNDALGACDLLCVPSAGESFGLVYLEAGGHGKPVVALDLPALR